MEKNKMYSCDVGYKLKVIAYAEQHGNRAAEWHFSPPPTEKTIRDWRASLALKSNNKNSKNAILKKIA